PTPGVPRSLLLLSDGYENTAPTVATVLPDVPGGVPVHTIALGATSDQVLLQHIAEVTGGLYFFSPDELGLFEIYDVARGILADSDMAAGDSIVVREGDSARHARRFTRRFGIERNAVVA